MYKIKASLKYSLIFLILPLNLLFSPKQAYSAGNSSIIEYLRRDIPNFAQVTPAIYRGANPFTRLRNGDGAFQLVRLGIALDINLQGGDIDDTIEGFYSFLTQPGELSENIEAERVYFENRGVRFANFPLNSHAEVTSKEESDIQEALQLMSQATPERPAYIHCEYGIDRTGLVVALYRVFYQKWSPVSAYKEWQNSGRNGIHRFFTKDLDNYFYRVTAAYLH